MALLSKRERDAEFRSAHASRQADGIGQSSPAGSLFLALEMQDFEAQVLAAWDPALREQAFVVVDQDPENHKTHVLACSPSARALGIRAGMPYAAVRRRWRHVAAHFRKAAWEAALREELAALCYRHTPEFELRDGGAALLDLAGTPALRQASRIAESRRALAVPAPVPPRAASKLLSFPTPPVLAEASISIAGAALAPECRGPVILARRLQHEVRSQTGLTDVALGLAATRLMARVMARQAHPAGLCICPPGREAEWLAPMEPSVLPGLSPQCRDRIRRYAFTSVGQIQALGREAIAARFGEEGDKLYTLACGLDLSRVAGKGGKGGGIRAETVLHEDLNDDDALARVVRLTADKLAFRLREGGCVAAKLTMAIRYSDHRSVRKTLKVAPATDGFEELADLALLAFRGLYTRRVALRAILLVVDRPETEKGQLDLFEGLADRRARAIGEALTRIRVKRGFAVIGRGSAQAALQQNLPYS